MFRRGTGGGNAGGIAHAILVGPLLSEGSIWHVCRAEGGAVLHMEIGSSS